MTDEPEQGEGPPCEECGAEKIWVEADKHQSHGTTYSGYECPNCDG